MTERKPEWPEPGDLVIATIETVTDYGAYANLDEYNKRGLLHVSEISSSWIRNIRDYVREGQKTVLKVLRVDPEKGHIDLSLRRVTKRAKIEKIRSWKQDRKAEALLREIAEKLAVPNEELYTFTIFTCIRSAATSAKTLARFLDTPICVRKSGPSLAVFSKASYRLYFSSMRATALV